MNVKAVKIWLKSIAQIDEEIKHEQRIVADSLRRIDTYESRKQEFFDALNSISNPVYRRLLYLRYAEGKKWEEIETEMNYVEQHLHRIHSNAVKELCKYLKKE